jgi:hypothetical protein
MDEKYSHRADPGRAVARQNEVSSLFVELQSLKDLANIVKQSSLEARGMLIGPMALDKASEEKEPSPDDIFGKLEYVLKDIRSILIDAKEELLDILKAIR